MNVDFGLSKKPLTVFGMAGLADIVLLLLVFFLLTSTFIPQQGIQVNLPQANATAPTEAQHIAVAITAEGGYFLNDSPIARENLLEGILSAQGAKTTLVIRADKAATIDQFTAVAAAAKAAGLRVLMATNKQDLQPQ